MSRNSELPSEERINAQIKALEGCEDLDELSRKLGGFINERFIDLIKQIAWQNQELRNLRSSLRKKGFIEPDLTDPSEKPKRKD